MSSAIEAAGCTIGDLACECVSSKYQIYTYATPCLSSCGPGVVSVAVTSAYEKCSSYFLGLITTDVAFTAVPTDGYGGILITPTQTGIFGVNTAPVTGPSSSENSSTPVAAIAGGAVGGFAVLALMVIGIFFIYKRYEAKKEGNPAGAHTAAAHSADAHPPVSQNVAASSQGWPPNPSLSEVAASPAPTYTYPSTLGQPHGPNDVSNVPAAELYGHTATTMTEKAQLYEVDYTPKTGGVENRAESK